MQDGDRVLVWLRLACTTRHGETVELEYNNHYVVRDGKVAVMRNFTDTSAVAEILSTTLGPSGRLLNTADPPGPSDGRAVCT
jgi:hypothetical protein